MVLQEKIGQDGQIARFKARLVVHGFRQRPGIDFTNTYLPTISHSAIRLVLSKAAAEDKEIIQLDIVTAFLESKVEEELYLKLPKEFVVSDCGKVELGLQPNRTVAPVIVQLKRSLYGLKQS